ncbi:hypothetical protein OIU79_031077 [Salix purpurea]|uniref:Uncharacterized protein n=1 Tax=Salix purpurea TaxID=77065 RepID=A0A9Q0VA10_SALPP|nr:hypothetical protein OIU79_031077 [Salix purpurea]
MVWLLGIPCPQGHAPLFSKPFSFCRTAFDFFLQVIIHGLELPRKKKHERRRIKTSRMVLLAQFLVDQAKNRKGISYPLFNPLSLAFKIEDFFPEFFYSALQVFILSDGHGQIVLGFLDSFLHD